VVAGQTPIGAAAVERPGTCRAATCWRWGVRR